MNRPSLRRFAGLGLADGTPDVTTHVRFRARLCEHGLNRGVYASLRMRASRMASWQRGGGRTRCPGSPSMT
ncbi:MAG: transposase [Phycisphaerales bacterium]|nr:transposase [Phycisphaerales bacterium]